MKKLIWITVALFSLSLAAQDKPPEEKTRQAGAARVYRFDSLDIEGHVKTPQLMVFFKRVQNRFKAFRLPKEKFSQKTIQSKDEDFLK